MTCNARRGGSPRPGRIHALPLLILPLCATAFLVSLHEPPAAGETSLHLPQTTAASLPSKYGRLTSPRWAYGAEYVRRDLPPVANTNPHPEPQPHRDHPRAMALTPDGSKLYVALPGNEADPGREVAVFDVARRKVLKRITVGSSPTYLEMHPAGRFLVVLNRFSNYASVIDTQADRVTAEIPLDFYCSTLLFDPSGTRAYVTSRALDQVLVLEVQAGESFSASVRPRGGFDEVPFLREEHGRENVHQILRRSCGTTRCHRRTRGGYYAGDDALKAFFSAIENSRAGAPDESLLLRAVLPVSEGGFADAHSGTNFHAGGRVVWSRTDPDYQEVAGWIRRARLGPGIPVGNFGSKPWAMALGGGGRYLYVGNQGTHSIGVLDLWAGEEVSAIYTQNVITDLALYRDVASGREILVAASMGLGFGAPKERDPFGGESGDPDNEAAQFTLLRDLETTEPLPLDEQKVLGPFDAVDGTAAFKMNDIQSDLLAVDVSGLKLKDPKPDGQLRYSLRANRYEAHHDWVRYTSDSAEILPHDISGDIPPELQRVVGAFPEALCLEGDRLFVAMLGSYELVEWKIDAQPGEASDLLEPVAVYPTGVMPRDVVAGPAGTVAEGLVFVANSLGETVSVIDRTRGESREYVVGDLSRPFPDTNAERGEMFVNTTVFSVDQDTSCFSCHIYGTSDGRGWGAGQAIAQMKDGHFVSGGMLAIPQLRNLFAVQPFYFEGTHSVFDAQFDDAREHVALQGFLGPNPHGDLSWLEHPTPPDERPREHEEIQDKMSTASWGTAYANLLERRNEHIRRLSMQYFGKAFAFRDFQRFIGEYQAAETRLLPNPFDQENPSVKRGRILFNDLSVGCVTCHRPPHFTNKSEELTHNAEAVLPALISFTEREKSFTLVGPHYMDRVNGYTRDLETWDGGRIERQQGHVTSFPLRGLFDRPFAFLHHGRALSLRETFATPGHYSLRRFRYSPLRGGEEIRPDGRERGFNELSFLRERTYMPDTHGATSHLTALQVQDLENFLLSIE